MLGAKYNRLVLPRSPVWNGMEDAGTVGSTRGTSYIGVTGQCGKETATTAGRLAANLQSVRWSFQVHKGHIELDLNFG